MLNGTEGRVILIGDQEKRLARACEQDSPAVLAHIPLIGHLKLGFQSASTQVRPISKEPLRNF